MFARSRYGFSSSYTVFVKTVYIVIYLDFIYINKFIYITYFFIYIKIDIIFIKIYKIVV